MKSREILRDLTDKYWKQVREAPSQGRKVAWCSGISPIDLLKVMDFTLVFPENYAATCGARKVATRNCETGRIYRLFHRYLFLCAKRLGGMLSGEILSDPAIGLPRPDLLLVNNYCLPIIKWFEETSRFYKIPLIVLEQGFRHDTLNQQDIEGIVQQNTEQLKDIVAFLEQFTGKRFDYDKLQASAEISMQCNQLWHDVLEMGKNIPAPYTCFDYFNSLFPIMCLKGEQGTVSYYKQLKSRPPRASCP